jgi:polyisoprenyl-teichoic acid--peptidoglycan teichoic acid transferase
MLRTKSKRQLDNEVMPPDLWEAKRRRRHLRQALWFSSVCLSLVIAVLGWGWWQAETLLGEFQEGAKGEEVEKALPELDKQAKEPLPGLEEAKTMLLIGSDVRAGEDGYGRSDTILVVRVYPNKQAASVLSLPRDLLVDIPGYGQDKINAAFTYGGTDLLIATVREYLGVPINHFFRTDFEGFAGAIAKLDGVYLPIDQTYYHSNQGLSADAMYSEIDIKPGYQKLEFEDALAWVRYRHGDNDFYRAARQQLFLREVGRQLRERAQDPLGLRKLLEIFAKATASDLDSVSETMDLANTLRQVPPDRLNRVTLEAKESTINGGSYLVASDKQKEKALKEWADLDDAFANQPERQQPKDNLSAWLDLKERGSKLGLDLGLSFADFSLPRPYSQYAQSKLSRAYRKSGTYIAPPPAKLKRAPGARRDAGLVSNSAQSVIGSVPRRLNVCTPEALPSEYAWSNDVRSYKIDGHPSLALYASAGSGNSILWMFSTWKEAPILESPTATVKKKKTVYNLYYESNALRMVSWEKKDTVIWITNTLRNEVSKTEMIELAQTCA